MTQTLTEYGLNKAREIMRGRSNENRNSGDAPGYQNDKNLPLTSEQAMLAAVVAEIAAHKAAGVDPAGTTWVVKKEDYARVGLRENADLIVNGIKIEVRNATRLWSPLPIKSKDNQPNLVVVQAYAHYDVVGENGMPIKGVSEPTGHVDFLGWRFGTDYKASKVERGSDTMYTAIKYGMEDLEQVLGVPFND